MEENLNPLPEIRWNQDLCQNHLNDYFHPRSLDYLKPVVSKVSKFRLEALAAGEVPLKNFRKEESKVDLQTFNWKEGHDSRNWWWQLQQLNVLDWLRGCWDLCDDSERYNYFLLTKKILFRWIEVASREADSPLAWHDHAACLRLRHIAFWFTFISIAEPSYLSGETKQRILDLIKIHVVFLCDEDNYSKHTNHGFDQAFLVYQLCLLWRGGGLSINQTSTLIFLSTRETQSFQYFEHRSKG